MQNRFVQPKLDKGLTFTLFHLQKGRSRMGGGEGVSISMFKSKTVILGITRPKFKPHSPFLTAKQLITGGERKTTQIQAINFRGVSGVASHFHTRRG